MQRCPSGIIAAARPAVQWLDVRAEMREGHRSFECRGCGQEMHICSGCDRGHAYCRECQPLRDLARRESKRVASLKYQQTRVGKRKHAARQGRWRQRQAEQRQRQAEKVTRQAPPGGGPGSILVGMVSEAGEERESAGESDERAEDEAEGRVAMGPGVGAATARGVEQGTAPTARGALADEPARDGAVRCDFCGRWCRASSRRGPLRWRGRGAERRLALGP